jgi:hypothetical protein
MPARHRRRSHRGPEGGIDSDLRPVAHRRAGQHRRRSRRPRPHRLPHLAEHRRGARQSRPPGGVHHRLATRRTDLGRDRATTRERLGRRGARRRQRRPRRAGGGPDRDHPPRPRRRPAGDLADVPAADHPHAPRDRRTSRPSSASTQTGSTAHSSPTPPAARSSSSTLGTVPRPTSKTG